MICYQDRTFCSFYETCATPCSRALTQQVRDDAKKWWGSDKAPICKFSNKPECYNTKIIQDEKD